MIHPRRYRDDDDDDGEEEKYEKRERDDEDDEESGESKPKKQKKDKKDSLFDIKINIGPKEKKYKLLAPIVFAVTGYPEGSLPNRCICAILSVAPELLNVKDLEKRIQQIVSDNYREILGATEEDIKEILNNETKQYEIRQRLGLTEERGLLEEMEANELAQLIAELNQIREHIAHFDNYVCNNMERFQAMDEDDKNKEAIAEILNNKEGGFVKALSDQHDFFRSANSGDMFTFIDTAFSAVMNYCIELAIEISSNPPYSIFKKGFHAVRNFIRGRHTVAYYVFDQLFSALVESVRIKYELARNQSIPLLYPTARSDRAAVTRIPGNHNSKNMIVKGSGKTMKRKKRTTSKKKKMNINTFNF